MDKKILFTGGGTGGHVYPLIAVAEKMDQIAQTDVRVEYIGPKSKWSREFSKRNIKTHSVTGAKLRRYFDPRNLLTIPKFFWGLFEAWVKMFFIMPDVVFSKGGPGSIAVVLAAKFYFIPVVVHESDSAPSLTTKITSKFAKRIGVSFKKTLEYLPRSKCFVSGNPIRESLTGEQLKPDQAQQYLSFDAGEPVILILGGSQGSARMNSLFLDHLNEFIEDFQIYHQVGEANFDEVKEDVDFMTRDWSPEKKKKYKVQGHLSAKDLRYALNAADLVVSRAGSGAIFEVAALGKPSILVPLEESAGNHQKLNAFEYSGSGAAIVIEEANFTVNIVKSRVKKILQSPQTMSNMSEAARRFARPHAANDIVREILRLS